MSEREKLIELIGKSKYAGLDTFSDRLLKSTLERLADQLLANGVIVLPCNMDNMLELNVYYKHHIKNKYAIVRYNCQRRKPYKIVSYDIQGKRLLQNKDIKLYDYLPSMNFTVILDGFDTKEEAEKALKGGATNEL